jgi:hypothetical protein
VHAPPTYGPPPGGDAARRRLAQDGWTACTVSTIARAAAALLLGLVVWSQAPALFGWESTVVMSGSMAPAIPAGDIAIVRPVEDGRSVAGQVLLVDDPDHPGELRLHRVIAVEEAGLRLQGDANAAPDTSLVPHSAVHGAGVLRIPAIGLPVLWSAQEHWAPLAVTTAALLAVLALAAWYRTPDAPADRPAVRFPPGCRRRYFGGPGRHAARSTRRTGWLRRAGVVGLLIAASPIALQPATRASAAYTADTSHAGDSYTMTRVLDWGCIDETAASAARYYAFRETAGTAAYNTGTSVTTAESKGNGTYRGGVTLGAAGPDFGARGAVTLDGSTGWISTAGKVVEPRDLTVQVWFRTSVPGGKVFGFQQWEAADGGQYDRHVYMTDAGELVFGIYRDGIHTIRSATGHSYADGAWHLVTVTMGPTGMQLYVDGAQVAADPTQTVGEPFTGHWRFGYGAVGGSWPNPPTNPYFTGSLASAAIWDRALTPAQVLAQHRPAA